MQADKEKFASQADPHVLAAMKKIAADEGRQLQSVLDEAMRDYIEKKKGLKPRASVMAAFQQSLSKNETLYKKLAE